MLKYPQKDWQHIASVILFGILLVLLLHSYYEIGKRIAYEASGPINVDSPVYLAVGRGMLNGLMPYQDLYEIKPPGIFLLSAASLSLTGGTQLVSWVQVVTLLSIFLSVAFPGILLWKKKKISWLMMLAGLNFGALLTMYASLRSGAFQVESFGAAFACLYISLITSSGSTPMNRIQTILAACSVAGAVFMKEPFALVLLGSAILLLPSWHLFWRNALVPAMFAIGLFLVAVAMTGTLVPYFSVYLNEMLFHHIHGSGPLHERILSSERIFHDLSTFNKQFAVVIAGLVLFAYVGALRSGQAWKRISVTVLALSLTMAAIAMGGQFYDHHFVFGVPFYASLFLLFLGKESGVLLRSWCRKFSLVAITIFLVAGLRSLPTIIYDSHIEGSRRVIEGMHTMSTKIDEVLNRCSLDRYMFLGANGYHPYAFTKHSPIGPLFFQFAHYFDGQRPLFTASFLSNFSEAAIVIRSPQLFLGKVQNDVETILATEFTTEPWPCAGNVALGGGYTMYFKLKKTPLSVPSS